MDGPFDRARVRANRNRAAADFSGHRFLHDLVFDRLVDRLDDIRRTFPCTVWFGPAFDSARRGALCAAGGVQTLIQADLAHARLDLSAGPCVQMDPEALAFADGSVDLILSILDLHSVNDLPGALIQIRRALRPDGVFLGALWGGQSLAGVRRGLVEAETSLRGGAAVRIAPFADAPTLAGLMQRAGFALPVVDRERVAVAYADPMRLFVDLKGMGEGGALSERPRGLTGRSLLRRAAQALEGQDVTFETMFLIGWAPHDTQPLPLKPGSVPAGLARRV